MTVDRIELSGLRVVAPVGVLAHEHETPQPLELDVVIETDMGHSGRTDDLANTVDYGAVLDDIDTALRATHHQLLERAATVVADVVLARPGVLAVEVVVRKLRPPVRHDLVATAARVRRVRPVGGPAAPAAGPPTRAYLALGSNLGDRLSYLRLALAALAPQLSARSRVYETDPVGGPENQGPYLNMVVAVDTLLDPFALLRHCHEIEASAGRVRLVKDGPRTLDVDLLLYEGTTIASPLLNLPHPRMWQRRFVLQPLGDVAPELLPDGWETSVDPGGVYPTTLVP